MAEANWKNRTIWTGDNLPIMRGMNSESVDLIYLDPPFNSKSNYAAPNGTAAAGAEFKDTWTLSEIDEAWLDLLSGKLNQKHLWRVIQAAMIDSNKSYLIYMAVRLMEMKRLLKKTGTIYVHCDPTMSHYLKLVMDAIFGHVNFRNEIVWHYYNGTSNIKRAFCRKHDVILMYCKTLTNNTFDEDSVREPIDERSNFVRNPEEYKDNYKPHPLAKRMHDVWRIPAINNMSKERTGYPTQKPMALLDRIIRASSKKASVVFDPFCGCATALVAADRLERDWVGIDISPIAVKLVTRRIKDDQGLFQDITLREDILERTDLGNLPLANSIDNKKFLYGEQAGYCNGCKVHFQMQHLTVDHIIAKAKGGTDHIENLQLLCGHCNSVKGTRGQEYLIAKLSEL